MSDANSGLNGKRKPMFGKVNGDKQKEIEGRENGSNLSKKKSAQHKDYLESCWKTSVNDHTANCENKTALGIALLDC